MEMHRKISKAEFKFPNWFPPGIHWLISRILDPNPKTRISIAKIMDNSWFRKGLGLNPVRSDIKEKDLATIDTDAIFGPRFDLSGLFEANDQKKRSKPAKTIITKLDDIAKCLKLKVVKKNRGLLKLEGSKEGQKGVLSIDTQIFEVTSTFHLVEVKRSEGDTLEYQKIMKQDIRPALKDIVWTWQGDRQQP
ncbi:hypothetical protein RJ639_021868 [Escallonia herrerae]|uniref:non-specific serine/threonine protein kinase n=1 Tax=Escallonia herrerae TaxID=1293975 RepID=A0AA88V4H7_9ASTE|nr:hypothetical protein RJ639_021868 [Escallonia herrerae]